MNRNLHNFVMKALRRADGRYPYRGKALKDAFAGRSVNPKTGRMCNMYRCAVCRELFTGTQIQVDHIDPVIPVEGFKSWDDTMERLFIEPGGRQVLCKPCHTIKSNEENKRRRDVKYERADKPSRRLGRRKKHNSGINS